MDEQGKIQKYVNEMKELYDNILDLWLYAIHGNNAELIQLKRTLLMNVLY